MNTEINEVEINGTKYIKKSDVFEKASNLDGMEYKIVRTYSAGVFAGYVESRKDKEVIVRKARRIYYWDGASTLSQLAVDGTSKPENCKFPCEVEKILLLDAIEILDVTEKAKKSINEVKIWKQ